VGKSESQSHLVCPSSFRSIELVYDRLTGSLQMISHTSLGMTNLLLAHRTHQFMNSSTPRKPIPTWIPNQNNTHPVEGYVCYKLIVSFNSIHRWSIQGASVKWNLCH